MHPTTVYQLGHARLAELHRQAQRDELAGAVRRVHRSARRPGRASGRPTILTGWVQRVRRVSVS